MKDNLIAARALIDTPEKWRQDGKFGYGKPAMCALGACWNFVDTQRRPHRMIALMANALRAQLPRGSKSVADFNDLPATTHADIMALFDRAIEAAS